MQKARNKKYILKECNVMKVSEYFDSIEGTEQERVFLEKFAGMDELQDLKKLTKIPLIGKMLKALAALSESGSIADYKTTDNYAHIKDWDIVVRNLEKGDFTIQPGPEQRKKIFKVFIAVSLVVAFIVVLAKLRRCREC